MCYFSNINAFIYFVVFYLISDFSLQMSLLLTLLAPMLGLAKSSARRSLFNLSSVCVLSSLLGLRLLSLNLITKALVLYGSTL
jgi:hypothetical protein